MNAFDYFTQSDPVENRQFRRKWTEPPRRPTRPAERPRDLIDFAEAVRLDFLRNRRVA